MRETDAGQVRMNAEPSRQVHAYLGKSGPEWDLGR